MKIANTAAAAAVVLPKTSLNSRSHDLVNQGTGARTHQQKPNQSETSVHHGM